MVTNGNLSIQFSIKGRGKAHQKAGNKKLAIANFQKALELEADNKSALKALEKTET